MHFHFPVVISELAVHQPVTGLGNMTKPVLGYVRARCYSETRAWDGFVKQKDHAVFTRALKQCT